MARYFGPKHKLCRKEGTAICGSEKCPVKRGKAAPGMHGAKRKRITDYGVQLREKQKVKMMYGILERQFRKYFEEAVRKRGVTGEILLRIIELRLDNIIFRLGFGSTRPHARQIVRYGKVKVNNKVTNIPSFRLKKGDVIEVDNSLPLARSDVEIPSFIKFDVKNKKAKIIKEPKRDDLELGIKEQLIVEYYSR